MALHVGVSSILLSCCTSHDLPAVGWAICMLWCSQQHYMQQQHNCQLCLPCECIVMLMQLLSDFYVGRTCVLICLLSVRYLLKCHVSDASVLLNFSTCLHAMLDSMHMSLHCVRASLLGRRGLGLCFFGGPVSVAVVFRNCGAQN